jgi:hypothetical protein
MISKIPKKMGMLKNGYVGSRGHRADFGTVGPDAGPEMNRACQCGAQSASLVDMGQSNMTRVTWESAESRVEKD